jgi:hypothetical protein
VRATKMMSQTRQFAKHFHEAWIAKSWVLALLAFLPAVADAQTQQSKPGLLAPAEKGTAPVPAPNVITVGTSLEKVISLLGSPNSRATIKCLGNTSFSYRSSAATKEINEGVGLPSEVAVAAWDAVLGGGNHRPKFPAPQTPHPPSLFSVPGRFACCDAAVRPSLGLVMPCSLALAA